MVIPTMGKNILFMPDTINGVDSGAHSARATLSQLQHLGHTVAVYAKDAATNIHPDVSTATGLYEVPTQMRWYEFVYSPALLGDFVRIVEEFKPDYVFFAGSIQKPAILGKEARKKNIRTVYLFYINDYFCQRVYAGLKEGPCTQCISRSRLSSLFNGCVRCSDLPKWIKSEMVRYTLGREIKNSFKMLGYGNDQMEIARQFGVGEQNLALVGFQFSPKDLGAVPIKDDGYFVLTGQPIIQKGWHLLSLIFSRLQSQARIKVSFRDMEIAKRMIDYYGLASFVESGVLEIVTGLDDRRRYLDFFASSRAVILPSYYPTTGEFVLQESMFLGKPVHVFNVGVHKDILVDRQNAMVSDVGDLNDYARKIDEIEQDEGLRSMIGNGARKSANDFYSPERLKLLDNVFN